MRSAFDGLLGVVPLFLPSGTRIQLLDHSAGAPEGGAWLDSRIRTSYDENGRIWYEVDAPWTTSGTTDVSEKDYGRTWRRAK